MYNMLCEINIEVSSSNATERTYTISASHTHIYSYLCVFSLSVALCTICCVYLT